MWLGDDPDDLQRVRHDAAKVNQIPRAMRVAEIVCADADKHRPRVVAIAYPRGVVTDDLSIHTAEGGAPVGSDVSTGCRCAAERHHLDGALIRSALLAVTGTRAATLRVEDLQRPEGVGIK